MKNKFKYFQHIIRLVDLCDLDIRTISDEDFLYLCKQYNVPAIDMSLMLAYKRKFFGNAKTVGKEEIV